MNKKYNRYIEYIVNDIQAPYFINMKDNYGLSEKEYEMVLSKLYDQPVRVKGNYVFDQNSYIIYSEDIDGYWVKYEYDQYGKRIYVEDSYGHIYDYR